MAVLMDLNLELQLADWMDTPWAKWRVQQRAVQTVQCWGEQTELLSAH
jgi:hypothetical protein